MERQRSVGLLWQRGLQYADQIELQAARRLKTFLCQLKIMFLGTIFFSVIRSEENIRLQEKFPFFPCVAGSCRGGAAVFFVYIGGNAFVDSLVLQGQIIVVL